MLVLDVELRNNVGKTQRLSKLRVFLFVEVCVDWQLSEPITVSRVCLISDVFPVWRSR